MTGNPFSRGTGEGGVANSFNFKDKKRKGASFSRGTGEGGPRVSEGRMRGLETWLNLRSRALGRKHPSSVAPRCVLPFHGRRRVAEPFNFNNKNRKGAPFSRGTGEGGPRVSEGRMRGLATELNLGVVGWGGDTPHPSLRATFSRSTGEGGSRPDSTPTTKIARALPSPVEREKVALASARVG